LHTASSDIELWNAFIEGSRESFSMLFRRYYPVLVQYGGKLCADLSLVEDAIQELFVELWQSHPKVSSVKAYLFKALKFKIFKQFRQKINHHTALTDDMQFEISHEDFLVHKNEDKEKADRIIKALKRLPNRQQEIIYLKLYQGLNYEELTEVMHINYQATRNLFYEAIKSLRKSLPNQ
jgi:RNA polymerase sigma factor (sigma-70 family)